MMPPQTFRPNLARTGRAVAASAAAIVLSAPLQAQQITGVVLDESTSAPVHGALVNLVSRGAVHARVLVDERGRFSIRAAGPGEYSLRIERIGYRTFQSNLITLGATDSIHRELRIPAQAVALDAVQVESTRRCEGATQETAVLWEEARKALTIAAWVNESGNLRYRIRRFERLLDARARDVLWEEAKADEVLHDRSPFVAWPIEDLLARGFVHRDSASGEWVSWGPGAEGLLSDAFLDAHCFRSARSVDEPDLIALTFEPTAVRNVTGIAGSLWLDRRTFELRRIDFHFVRPPWDVPTFASGGRIDYERLPSGMWIISRWVIHTPGMEGRRLRGVIAEGQELVEAYLPDGRRIR